ncbi:MAG: hypothetical protein V7K97_29270 [Nostoc sp.]|uniref:hypothetical protein n=1 Tax=Nostoc sp. TaxID=1180 RepID=UPI002FF89C27
MVFQYGSVKARDAISDVSSKNLIRTVLGGIPVILTSAPGKYDGLDLRSLSLLIQ